MDSIMSLQNGSDIRGVAIEGIAGQNVNLTEQIVADITHSFAIWLSKQFNKEITTLTISIGRDSRITGQKLLNTATTRLAKLGCTVFDCSIASTPSLFMSTQFEQMKCDGAIMLTASHLPFNRNGLKFFTQNGGLGKKDIKEILEDTYKLNTNKNNDKIIPTDYSFKSNYNNSKSNIQNDDCSTDFNKNIRKFDLISLYSEHLVNYIRKEVNHPKYFNTPLKNLKIIVDAGNGAGGFFTSKVLEPLGANTQGSQFLKPDGNFPNHIPNPEDNDAAKSIQQATLNNNADLGIIFDTDVDRAGVVDKSGNIINRNALIALLSKIILEETPNTTIVTDSVTSEGLTKFIESYGGKHHRFKRGYKNVIDESIKLNNEGIHSALAIETSGHGAIKDNYFLDDGAFLVTKILIALAKSTINGENLTSCLNTLKEPLESAEIRIPITSNNFTDTAKPILETFNDFHKSFADYTKTEPNYEGVRMSANNENVSGWFLIRLSLHDPIMPLQIETNRKGDLKKIALHIYTFLKQYDDLDLSVFDKYIC